MALLRRKPRKLIRASEAAEMLGYKSGITIKRMIVAGTFQGVRMKDSRTSPWLVYEAEVRDYLERQLNGA